MGLTTEGIIFMTLAWGSVLTLAGYCFYKVIISERKNRH